MTPIPTHRNGMIEFLRLLFALVIILFHGQARWAVPALTSHLTFFSNGMFAVEFFLIVAGFLMAQSAYRSSLAADAGQTVGRDTARFLAGRYRRIFPYFLFAFIVTFFVRINVVHFSRSDIFRLLAESFPQLFLMETVGIRYLMIIDYQWYLSAMLLSMLLLYPLIRSRFELFVNVIGPILTLFVLGWLSQTQGGYTFVWVGLVRTELLRALAEISLGAVGFGVCQRLRKLRFTRLGGALLSVAELGGYIACLVFICSTLAAQYVFYFVFVLAASVTLTFSEQTVTRRFFAKLGQSALNKLSLPLYVCQYPVMMLVWRYAPTLTAMQKIFLSLGLTCVVAVFCLTVVDFLRTRIPWRRLLLRQGDEPQA